MYDYGAYGATKRACLKQGDTGGDVRRLQVLLAPAVMGPTGKPEFFGNEYLNKTYGPSTAAYVEVFQERRGLKEDGIAGPSTWAELGEAGASCGSSSFRPPAPSGPGGVPDLAAYETPFYKEPWFLWTAGLGAAALVLGTLLWPKKRRTGNGR
jgi:peptidoglycan hydrolase-like protein with peptidoglycan-binding domain